VTTDQKITLYVGNRIDQACEVDPARLVAQFLLAVRAGYFTEPCGGGNQWAFRLWLTDPGATNATWEPDAEGALFNALDDAIQANDETRDLLALAIWGQW
jgi:hypothetical protein